MKEIQSSILGSLKQDETIEEWWRSDLVEIPFFDNKKIAFIFINFPPGQDRDFLREADSAVEMFLVKGIKEKESLSNLVYKNCMDFLNAVEYDEDDKRLWEIVDKNEIWSFVYPSEIFVTRRDRRDCAIYIQICSECEWEREHGLQLVFKKGRQLTRISDQDGHLTEADAYDKPDEEDELLSKFKD